MHESLSLQIILEYRTATLIYGWFVWTDVLKRKLVPSLTGMIIILSPQSLPVTLLITGTHLLVFI